MSAASRAKKKLTLVPKAEFTLEKDGFIEALYQPKRDEYPHKAVIMFGGSDGIYNLTKIMAEQFVKRGMTVLALAYWNEPGLPDCFEKIPIDPVEQAALWLREHNFEKIGLWGISMGAELALLAGSLMPELFSCVTAVCPTNISTQGFMKRKGVRPLECSAFSWHGEELPWTRLKFSKPAIIRDSFRERGLCLRSCYESAVCNASEETQIKVENINGPILLLYPEYDGMWPSEISAEKIRSRLKEKNFAHPCQCVSFKFASHMLVPVESRSKSMFRVERRYPKQCWKSDLETFEKTLAFWKEEW